jgi:hypothetical protein
MANRSYTVEVQMDFLEKITRANPVQALSEFIWNSVDADATAVDVSFHHNELDAMSKIIVKDNGTGMEFVEAPELFKKLGGSWKRSGATTKKKGRFLHGQDGRGRFKAFALGKVAEWDVVYQKGKTLWSFKVTMRAANLDRVFISDEEKAPSDRKHGVTLTISDVHKDYRSLFSEGGKQKFAEIFALYLADYRDISIVVNSTKIDPAKLIASNENINLTDVVGDGRAYPVRLEIIEWKSKTNRVLYLCNDKGFPLSTVDRRFHIGNYQFSAYIK